MPTFRYNITSYTNESINSSLDRNMIYNDINNEIFVGTKYEFYSKYKLDKSKVYRLLYGERKKHKGWSVKPSPSTSSPIPPIFPLE